MDDLEDPYDDPDDPEERNDDELDEPLLHPHHLNERDVLRIDALHPRRCEYEAVRARQNRLLVLRRRGLRDFNNPFDVTYEMFVKSYRLSQDLTFSLIDLLRPYITATTSATALPLELKVSAMDTVLHHY